MILLISMLIVCSVAYAEPPVTSFSITGENRYDYSNSVSNPSYLGKEVHNENRDFYSNTNQGSSGESLGSTYSGFSPSSHNSGFGGYSGSNQDSISTQYPPNSQTASTFRGYSAGTSNTDSSFDGYTSAINHGDSDANHYASSSQNSHRIPSYMTFSDNIPGSSSSSYSEAEPDVSSFRGYSTSTRGSLGYSDGEHGMTGGPSYMLSGGSEFPFGKPNDGIFGGSKLMTEAYPSSSDMKYVRVNQGSMYPVSSSMYLSSSGPSSVFSGTRGSSSTIYGSGKVNKYGNKYFTDYNSHSGLNYVPRDQAPDYLATAYGKGAAKVVFLKDSRPSVYSSQSHPTTYLSKITGSYKSKSPNFVSYPGANIGHSPMSSVHSSFSSNPYNEGHLPRGYRSSGAYGSGQSSVYSKYS